MSDAGVPGLVESARRLSSEREGSVELVARSLDLIEAADSVLSAFRSVRAEAALAEAELADQRLAAGERSPLLGVPIAIKDDMDLAGEPTRHGCGGEFPPKVRDGEVARRLRAAGAIIVGKTNLPEFGQWPFTEGAFGRTRNPWNLGHTPGGSSGGSAAAVAAGLVTAAVGSDGAGSVRIPAAWTNLVGIKPQRGRISTWPEPEAFFGLTSFGTLGRTVEDAALLLDCATGNHPGDRHIPPRLPESLLTVAKRADPGTLTVGLALRTPFVGFPVEPDRRVLAATERIATVIEALGHRVVDVDPPYRLIGAGFLPRSLHGLSRVGATVADASVLDPRTRSNMQIGRLLGGPALAAGRRMEALARRRFQRLFDSLDVLLTPATATPPPEIGHFDGMSDTETDRAMVGVAPYCWPWNVLGWPGVSVPAGFTDGGLPLGVQILSSQEREATLIGLAAQLQSVERWHHARPDLSDALENS